MTTGKGNELISFRLTPAQIEALQAFKQDGESNSLVVKRLFLSVINPSSDTVSAVSHQQSSLDIDVVKKQVIDELMPTIADSINELFRANMEPAKEEKQALLGK